MPFNSEKCFRWDGPPMREIYGRGKKKNYFEQQIHFFFSESSNRRQASIIRQWFIKSAFFWFNFFASVVVWFPLMVWKSCPRDGSDLSTVSTLPKKMWMKEGDGSRTSRSNWNASVAPSIRILLTSIRVNRERWKTPMPRKEQNLRKKDEPTGIWVQSKARESGFDGSEKREFKCNLQDSSWLRERSAERSN